MKSIGCESRKSNFELLRIISMLMIVAHHFVVHGKFEFSTDVISFERLWAQFIQMGGKIGVNVFVIICGYFQIRKKTSLSKLVRMILQIFTYSITVYLVVCLIGTCAFDVSTLFRMLLPISTSLYWFASTFVVLYIFMPLINKFVASLNKRNYKVVLGWLMFCWSIIPTFLESRFQSNDLIWFVCMYLLGGYLSTYANLERINIKYIVLLLFLVVVLTFSSVLFFDVVGMKIFFVGEHATYFYDMQRMPMVAISILLFLIFAKLRIRNSRIINIISSTMFGVYLIHDHPYIYSLTWENFFLEVYSMQGIELCLYSIGVILIVFVLAMCIELVRIYILERNYLKLINNMAGKLEYKFRMYFNNMCE